MVHNCLWLYLIPCSVAWLWDTCEYFHHLLRTNPHMQTLTKRNVKSKPIKSKVVIAIAMLQVPLSSSLFIFVVCECFRRVRWSWSEFWFDDPQQFFSLISPLDITFSFGPVTFQKKKQHSFWQSSFSKLTLMKRDRKSSINNLIQVCFEWSLLIHYKIKSSKLRI